MTLCLAYPDASGLPHALRTIRVEQIEGCQQQEFDRMLPRCV
jgi:hypothetical protein